MGRRRVSRRSDNDIIPKTFMTSGEVHLEANEAEFFVVAIRGT